MFFKSVKSLSKKTMKQTHPDLVPSLTNSSTSKGNLDDSIMKDSSNKYCLRANPFFENFSQFSRETSLHGLRRISSSIPQWQKGVWVCMIVGMWVTLVFQLKYKFESYWEAPVSLYLNVRYENAVPFPAVILCNANLFRISVTTTPQWHKLFDVINSLYRDPMYDVTTTDTYPHLKELDGSLFIKTAAHQKENLILSCQWPNGKKCSHINFRTIVTDYGVCYAINDGYNHSEVINVTNSGSSYGLYLVLNAEDYEAMSGPQKTVGIKVLIYKQGEIPLISEQGFDVAPGFQTSVGLRHREINRLESSKGGDCGTGSLYLFEHEPYSSKICTLDRKYYAAVNACNCLPYMVQNGVLNKSVCDAGQYFGCMMNASQCAKLSISKNECPQDCQIFEYQQYVSFSELSTSHINNILTPVQRQAIQTQYLVAREARSRHTEIEITNDAVLAESLLLSYDEFENLTMVPGSNWETVVDNKLFNLTCYQEHVMPLINMKQFCAIEALENMLTKNLERILLPQMKDNIQRIVRELNASANSFTSLIEDIGRYFTFVQPTNISHVDEIHRVVVQHLFVENSKNVLKLANQTLELSLKDVGADLKTLENHWIDVENISSLRSFNQSDKMVPTLTKTLKCLANMFAIFPNFDEIIFFKMPDIRSKLRSAHALSEQCVQHLDRFHKIFSSYQDVVASYKANHTVILEHIKVACNKFNRIRQTSSVRPSPKVSKIDEYHQVEEIVSMFLERTRTKANTSKAVLDISQKLQFPQIVRTYFDDVKRYVGGLQNDLFKDAQIAFTSLINFYSQNRYSDMLFLLYPEPIENNNMTEILLNANACLPLMNSLLENISSKSDDNIDLYFKAFSDFKDEMQKYNNSLKLDMQFFKNNLLALNIYLREMSTEVLAQRLSYDSWSLLSDIGGTLGLFLGASLLTMGEILEYLVNQCLLAIRVRRNRRKFMENFDKLTAEQARNLVTPIPGDYSIRNDCNNIFPASQFDVTILPKKHFTSLSADKRSRSFGDGYMVGKHEYHL